VGGSDEQFVLAGQGARTDVHPVPRRDRACLGSRAR
jgi:hypothetical protein